ncbi:MAG: right-handed parallel beta-helix repeat-containing protein [Nanoarchaeota archaeon]
MYFKKKSEIVVVIVLTLIILGSFFLIIKSGNYNGLTGAGVIRIQTDVSACGTLSTAGDTYILTQNIAAPGDGACINITANSITLNCVNYTISYASAAANLGIGIDNAGYTGTTIQNCHINGGAGAGPAIFFRSANSGTIYNNTIITTVADSAGIVLSHSINNSIYQNNITVTGAGSNAIVLNGTSTGNSVINLNASAGGFAINDTASGTNTISFDNKFGQLNVTSTNLTVTSTNLVIDTQVFLSSNRTGLLGSFDLQQLNKSATIKLKGLNAFSYTATPQLLKDRVRCDYAGGPCTVTSWLAANGILTATINSFSNYTTLEADPPTVSNFKPINGSNFSSQEDIRFNASVTDGTAVSTVFFMFNNYSKPYNLTTTYVSGASPYWNASVNMVTLEEKVHDVFVFANDTYNNVIQTTKTTIFVDRTAPTVNSYNGSSFSTNAGAFSVFFNFTDNVFSTASCSFYVDNSLKATNASTFNDTYTQLTLDAAVLEGAHNVSVNCTDGSGNKGSTFLTVSFDVTGPPVIFTGPANTSNFSTTGLVDFNATVTDALSTVEHVIYQFNNASFVVGGGPIYFNVTATNYSGIWNVTLDLSLLKEGSRNVRIFASDSVGNIDNSTEITITVDRTAPNITFLLPTNGSVQVANFSTGSIELRAEVEDTLTAVNQVIFGFRNTTGELNYTAVPYDSDTTPDGIINYYNYSNFDLSVLGEGEYTVSVYATDYANNLNNTASITINIDRTAPSFINGTNTSTGFYQDNDVTFNITINDTRGVDNYIFSSTNNAAGAWSNDTEVKVWTDASGKIHSITLSFSKVIIPEGVQVCWYFWANDTLGNSGNSSVRCFTVASTATVNNPPSGGDGTTTTTPATSATPTTTQPSDGTTPATSLGTDISIGIGDGTTTGPIAGEGPSTNPISPTISTTVTISNDGTKEIELAVDVKDEVKLLENSAAIKQSLMEKYQAQGISAEEQQKLAEQELEIIALIEQEDVIQAHTAKIIELAEFLPTAFTNLLKDKQATPIWPTGEHVKARLLKSSLVNGEQEEIVIMPGETFQQEIKVKKGLSLDMSKAVHLTFSSGGKEVYQKGLETTEGASIGTAIDIDPENKIFDTYILIPKNTPGKYTLDLEINQKDNGLVNTKPLPFKTNFILNLLKKFSDNIYTETLGPYKVNEEGALLALQMGYDETAFSENYEIVGKLYNNNKLVAVNSFSNK